MKNRTYYTIVYITVLLCFSSTDIIAQNSDTFEELKGKIVDADSNTPLTFTDIVITNSYISTVTNNDGEFLLKIPTTLLKETVSISHLGYEKRELKVSEIKLNAKIKLTPALTALNTINITTRTKNARDVIIETLKKKSSLYNNKNTVMTAFYRETIKKRRKNASLSEAVVKIHKQPYNNIKNDHIELIKARKNTDYSKLDTLALKLQGGPFSNLYTDIIKYPEFIFTSNDIPMYAFSFDNTTVINGRDIFVINFRQNENISTPLYYGKLYIDAETLALTNAVYSLNISNRALSSNMFVRKKPKKVDVYPTQATYRVNYRTTNGKWHYAYSNIALTFKVNWKGKLFNSVYTLNSEMAVTDWEIHNTKLAKTRTTLIRPTTILSDKTSGFSDPEFWGSYNIIEPEKSIESAIRKIQKQLKRT
ncbi:carboxypeptidase-like regulatory domain-containing protein [Algibacter pectinivorans]|uniref:CarboxypepD_reg-like domain-containing protein n=1 Tax=Algibacter pectinivorans TaxID=870482 RepID=A0A1I1QIJ2_9FLAO|nr:carboxypeptidase-like regulatory domain-containing protein [Algibacter pectinivorans]SFD21827.1 CarboxypepD_reg-like domain-containing protein [Algibacter pectinivorans]